MTSQKQSIVLSNLGVLEFAEGRYEEAKALLQEALAQHRSVDPEGEMTFPNLSNLSIAVRRDILFHRIPDSQKVIATELKEHGSVDALVADLLNNVGACYEVLGDLEEARQFYQESLNLRRVSNIVIETQ